MTRDNFIWKGSYYNNSDVGYGYDYYDPTKDVSESDLTNSEEE